MPFRYGVESQDRAFAVYLETGSEAAAAKAVSANVATIHRWVLARRKVDQEFNRRLSVAGFVRAINPSGKNGTDLQIVPLPGQQAESAAAERALQDFAYFRYRYLGRHSTPWQEEAAQSVVQWVTSPETEFIVVNCPPGSGKSTLFVNDIPLWLICRDRTIRILIGSSTSKLAAQYSGRMRRMLERTRPLPSAADRETAEGCLAVDYGRFRPDTGADIWRRDEFTVLAQQDIDIQGESSVEDKEPTVSSFGMDSEFLGARAKVVLWDDLVTSRVLRSSDAVIAQQEWWSNEAECVPGWAELNMADGSLKRADQLKVGDKVAGLEGPTPVTGIGDNGEQLVYRVQTRGGRILHVTGNHPLYTPAGWIRADHSLGYGVQLVGAWPHDKLETDDAALLGYLVGDGSTGPDNAGNPRAGFTNADSAVLQRFTTLCETRGWTVRAKSTRSRATDLAVSGGVRDFIREHQIMCLAQEKRVPSAVMAGGTEAWKAFLCAYFDCDGTVYREPHAQVRFASTSHQLLLETQMLLARLGIKSRVGTPNRKNGTYRPCWTLSITGKADTCRFAEFPITDIQKAERLAAYRIPPRFTDAHIDWIESVEPLGVMPTVAIETHGHTFGTGGIVTHNTRVEPGGALILQGQRLGANDLYRFALDQLAGVEDGGTERPRYHHVLYPAHFEDRCRGDHGREDSIGRLLSEAKDAYPKGCLLDPHRLPWYGKSGLLTIQTNRAEKYRVVYQQEDVDPQNVLVLPVWVDGGRGKDGIEYPGCWDNHRGFANLPEDLPRGLSQPWYSIATVDPSPTNFWAVEWWLYHPASEQRFLLDIHRDRMDANDLHGWNANDHTFYGLMHDWQVRSKRLGIPITTWIVEQNAAQRWLLTTEAMKRWRALYSVNILGHNTIAANKLDEQRGIESIGDRFRFGNIRLPGKTGNWQSPRAIVTQTLVREATRYPEKGTTDDCLMAAWFLEWNLPYLAKPIQARQPQLPRPSWMKRAS